MAKRNGTWVGLTWNRRLTADLMHFGKKFPCITLHREFRLGPITRARNAAPYKIAWTILFAKAFALTAKEHPELRRAYMPLPWAHFYEYPESIGMVTVERDDQPEPYPMAVRLVRPEAASLVELDERLRRHKDLPMEQLTDFRRYRQFGRLPWPVRYAVWWSVLNLSGRRRIRAGGTFAITSVSSLGAGVSSMFSPTTSNLHFGLLSADDRLDVRLTFDHRVYDGGQGARTLKRIEEILNEQIVAELIRPAQSAAA